MAKETTHRTLTSEEVARRKATMAGDTAVKVSSRPEQTSAYSGSGESYEQRVERASAAVPPWSIDYDRDGYPDELVGRSGRNFTQRARQANGQSPSHLVAPAPYVLSNDGFRQGQIGYRDRLRARLAAVAALAEDPDKATASDRAQAMTQIRVMSHGSTGVPGGSPGGKPLEPSEIVSPPYRKGITPVEQAVIAPRTARTGFANAEASRSRMSIAVPIPSPVGGRSPAPEGAALRANYTNLPHQGTLQADGSFAVPPSGAPAAPESPDEGKTKPKAHEPAKAHEHSKPAEHKPVEHTKPPEHGKHPEHHDKK